MARPTQDEITEAIETLGGLVSRAGGDGDDALTVVKAAVTLPELMGRTAAAKALGVDSANLHKIAGLPDPLYDLPAGKFYDADEIRAKARERKAARA